MHQYLIKQALHSLLIKSFMNERLNRAAYSEPRVGQVTLQLVCLCPSWRHKSR